MPPPTACISLEQDSNVKVQHRDFLPFELDETVLTNGKSVLLAAHLSGVHPCDFREWRLPGAGVSPRLRRGPEYDKGCL